MITYLLQVSLCWVFFYLIYHSFLRKETFFGINRIYLMGTLLISLYIPQLGHLVHNWFKTSPAEMGQMIYYVAGTPEMISNIILPVKEGFTLWEILLYSAYVLGVLMAASKFIFGLKKIYDLYRHGRKINKEHFVMIETEEPHLPFSFFHFVFISKKIPLKEEVKEIITHELCHVRNLHSLDIIALELIHILFWFNPILILYKKALRHAHEYTADATVLQHSDAKNYGQILLGQSSSGIEVALANHFFNSQLKNRMTMMYQKKSGKKALIKYLAAIPILLLTAFLFSNSVIKDDQKKNDFLNEFYSINQSEDLFLPDNTLKINGLVNNYLEKGDLTSNEINDIFKNIASETGFMVSIEGERAVEKIHINEFSNSLETNQKKTSENIKEKTPLDKPLPEVFTTVDQKPRFPGCEELEISIPEKEECSRKKLVEYLIAEIKYPVEAKDNGTEGTVIVQFIITEQGKITDAEVIKGIGDGCDEEALAIVNKMNNMEKPWTPGMKDGEAVAVQYSLPINFKLQGDGQSIKNSSGVTQKTTSILPHQIYEMSTIESGNRQTESTDELFTSAEQMPRFPGCEESNISNKEKDECAKKAMLEYIYQNLTYPQTARDRGVEGMTVIQFVVTKDGGIKNVKVVRDIGENCGNVAADVVRSMNNLPEKWTPGMQRGKAVDVLYTLPVQFKLDQKAKVQSSPQEPLMILDGKILRKNETNEIDPKSIKGITVFKGPKAIELYGNAGKNGVVVITTRDGKISGDKVTHQKDNITIEGNAKIDFSQFDDKLLFVIDDKIIEKPFSRTDLLEMDIEKIYVLKNQIAIDKYGEKGKDGVVEIITKKYSGLLQESVKDKNENEDNIFLSMQSNEGNKIHPLYIIDGVIHGTDADQLSKLAPNEVKSINVLKGQEAIKKYGGQAADGAIEISTIKNQKTNEGLPSAINDLSQIDFLTEFKVFPIPSNGNINVELSGTPGPLNVRVFALDGKLIHSEDFTGFNGKLSTTLVNSAFNKTTAIIAVIQENQVQTKKVVFE